MEVQFFRNYSEDLGYDVVNAIDSESLEVNGPLTHAVSGYLLIFDEKVANQNMGGSAGPTILASSSSAPPQGQQPRQQ
jgi:hypothetical protein